MHSKKVLVLGITGLVGKELTPFLINSGYEVYAISRHKNNNSNIHTFEGDLFDKVFIEKIIKKIKPECLLNLAWYTTNDYLMSDLNYLYLESSIYLLHTFIENGGERVINFGTCFEYKFDKNMNRKINEIDPLDVNKNPYTFCKNKVREIQEYMALKNSISFVFARLFYVYGNNESSSRLFGALIKKLLNNENVVIYGEHLIRDYMYTKDIASAIVSILNCSICGDINICNGYGYSLGEIAKCIGKKLRKEELIEYKDAPNSQPFQIIGDNEKLYNEVGFKPTYNLYTSIDEVIMSYYPKC